MDRTDIISSLQEYIRRNPKLVYYKECLAKIEELPHNNNIIKVIPNDALCLEAVRIHICYNIDRYRLFIYDKPKKNCSYVKHSVTEDVFDKLIYQLVTIKKHNSIMGLADKTMKVPKFAFKQKDDKQIFYLLIRERKKPITFKNKAFELENLYESMGYVLGVDTFKLLYHQRLDRIVDFIEKGGESRHLYELLDNYLKLMQKMDWKDRERMLVHSGPIYQALGTTYTRDIDILVVEETKPRHEVLQMIQQVKKTGDDFDLCALSNDGAWQGSDGTVLRYRSTWFTTLLPALGGAMDIFETVSNPTHYFMFMGIKFISIEMNIKRFLQRSNVGTYVDLLMLEELNNFNLSSILCIPNMTVRQGRLVVFDDRKIEQLHTDIKCKLQEYYKKDVGLDEIKKRIKRCMQQSFEIYRGPIVKDPDTGIIKGFHLTVKEEIYAKYAKNANYLLDVGSGQLTDLRFWNINNVKHAFGIEPSIHSIEKALERIEKFGSTTEVKIVNSVGNVDWTIDPKFKELVSNKYDVVTFQYTIHYMLNSIDLMINNLKAVIKKGTRIIITCMDGNKIQGTFVQCGKVEVRNDQEPIFAIVPMYNPKQVTEFNGKEILVYFKGAYGVANGSVEPIVDINKLISKFAQNGIKLLERRNFLDFNLPLKHKMRHNQKQVSGYYMALIFEYQ
jgi:SAM-dependent methyltransferase